MANIWIRFLLLVLVFAAVLLATEALFGMLADKRARTRRTNQRLQMIEEGASREEVRSRLRRTTRSGLSHLPGLIGNLGRSLETTLNSSGLPLPAPTLFFLLIAASAIIALAGMLVALLAGVRFSAGTVLMLTTVAVMLGFALPMMVISRIADRRKKKMQEQFPVALDIFVRGLRAGHPVSSALNLLTEEMSDPIGSEFGLVVDEITYGAEIRDALQNMADRWQIDDIQMFVVSLSVQGETGGNLAEILENLAGVIRERSSLMMKVRALSSEGRMTAALLTALPILAFLGLFLVNPRFYLDVAQERAFIVGYVVLGCLYAVGFISIRRMIDLKV